MSTSFQTSDGTNTVYVDGLVIGDATGSYWSVVAKTSSAFTGGTTNAHGDFDGTGNPYSLFTVTGVVEVSVIGVCSVDLTGASATLEVGCSGATASLIAQTTATDIDANEIWADTAPSRVEAFPSAKVINQNIIETAGTANITAGQITYYCMWRAISSDGNVVAA